MIANESSRSSVPMIRSNPKPTLSYWRKLAARWRTLAFPRFALASLLAACTLAAHAQVTVKDPWVRGTVKGQAASGGFMTLTSSDEAKIVAVASPVARVAEIHATRNDRGMMVMEHVESLALPKGKAVEFKPGGHHVMLMGLSRPLSGGETVPITFTLEHPGGRRSTLEVRAPVRPLGQ
jgi:periplasmic copper chaperone A